MTETKAAADFGDSTEKTRKIKVFHEPSSAGYGSIISDSADDNFEIIEVKSSLVPHRATFGVRIKGDSMNPKILDGDIVWVEYIPQLNSGDIGIFSYNGESYCKKYIVDFDNKVIRLVSFNPIYDDILIYDDRDLRTIGRVIF